MRFKTNTIGTATMDFKGKLYSYNFIVPADQSNHGLALAISTAKFKSEGKNRYTGQPPAYNLVMEMLKHNSNYKNSSEIAGKVDNFKNASELENAEIPSFEKCCNDPACKKCKGTGEFVYLKHWRVGLQQSNTLIIDIDGSNRINMRDIRNYYSRLLSCSFVVVRTSGGYWLIADKKYTTLDNWLYDNCRLLQPPLQYPDMKGYIEQLERLSVNPDGSWKKISGQDIKDSNLFNGIGEFDVLFTHLNIKWKRCTIRISKKKPNDKIEEIKI